MNRHLTVYLLPLGLVLLSTGCLQARPQYPAAQEATSIQPAEPSAAAGYSTPPDEPERITEYIIATPGTGKVAAARSVSVQTKPGNNTASVSVSSGVSSGSSGNMAAVEYGSSGVQPSSNSFSIMLQNLSRSPETIIVLPGGDSAETDDSLREDMTIMTRILDERIPADAQSPSYARFYVGSRSPRLMMGSRQLDGLYVPDYGALFWNYVSIPLAPPAAAEAAPDEQETVDPVWDRAKRQMLSTDPAGDALLSVSQSQPTAPYDQEKVDALLDRLIQTLKHASNIRAIPPTEWITVIIVGSVPDVQVSTAISSLTENNTRTVSSTKPLAVKGSTAALITVRARKADIDAYAQGAVDFEQFKKTVQIHRSSAAAPEPSDQ